MRMKDIKAVRAELKKNKDPVQEIKLRRLLQRLTNQVRETKKKKVENVVREKEIENIQNDLSEGKQHRFKNKCES